MKYKTLFILIAICALSLFLNMYQQGVVPPCFNADEAAFSYNAFSLAQTGRDEYGAFMPIRLKSFGDFKMPLYTYLSVPFIRIFGLNEYSAVYANHLLAFLLPIAVFLLAKELFKKTPVALLSAFLVSASLGLHIVSRHAHEAYLGVFTVTLTSYLFLRVIRKASPLSITLFAVSLMSMLFSYQSNRIFIPFFLAAASIPMFRKSVTRRSLLITTGVIVVVFALFSVGDIIYKPERVKNLLFFNNSGYTDTLNELRGEGGPRVLYNKAIYGIRTVLLEHATYFSPQFLTMNGDANYRFGYPGMGPMTLVEYAMVFVGMYYLFRKRESGRYFISALILLTPFSASLSWAHESITRPLFLFVPLLIIAAYGIYHFTYELHTPRARLLTVAALIAGYIFFQSYAWDFYLNHYPKRPLVIRAWQCGYRELGQYVKQHYNDSRTFYITRKNGEPYIMLLFYLNFPPANYQRQATLTAPDEYGFGQVDRFDKFNFNFRIPHGEHNYVAIGYPDDFNGTGISKQDVTVISQGTEEIFWIYEAK